MMVAQKIENLRSQRINNTPDEHKSIFGQYLTPNTIASFMSHLLIDYSNISDNIKILDPGAGQGILSVSLIELLKSRNPECKISLDAYEIDDSIIDDLNHNLKNVADKYFVEFKIWKENFINNATQEIGWKLNTQYSHVIMNPPYKKLNVSSSDYLHLKEIGIETTNYYSAFIGISILMLKANGLIVAIIPRSFCNGKYFLNFRKFILSKTKILHIHSFKSRTESFQEEGVLQENIILVLKKTEDVIPFIKISTSSNRNFSDYKVLEKPLSDIVNVKDPELYFHIPTEDNFYKMTTKSTFMDLGIKISTGPIVDFRIKEALRQTADSDSIPLLYSVHLRNGIVTWPVVSKKPNAINLTPAQTAKIAFPKGYYVVVKRFSSKEEKRRIWATLITPDSFSSSFFTVENHINIFHDNKHGIDKNLAIGLFVYMNTLYADVEFRRFSGHTQVNATDLKQLKYPSGVQLNQMAALYEKKQYTFDEIFEMVVE